MKATKEYMTNDVESGCNEASEIENRENVFVANERKIKSSPSNYYHN